MQLLPAHPCQILGGQGFGPRAPELGPTGTPCRRTSPQNGGVHDAYLFPSIIELALSVCAVRAGWPPVARRTKYTVRPPEVLRQARGGGAWWDCLVVVMQLREIVCIVCTLGTLGQVLRQLNLQKTNHRAHCRCTTVPDHSAAAGRESRWSWRRIPRGCCSWRRIPGWCCS